MFLSTTAEKQGQNVEDSIDFRVRRKVEDSLGCRGRPLCATTQQKEQPRARDNRVRYDKKIRFFGTCWRQ